MLNQLYAIKQRMHQEFIAGKRTPITSLLVPEHVVFGTRTNEKDGYDAVILELVGTSAKSRSASGGKKREVKLTEAAGDTQAEVEKVLTAGTIVTVSARSKGKGFAGVMKRWGFHGGPRTHGQSDRSRAPGSIARGTTPGRVLKGKHMAGHMGNVAQSVRNLKVIEYNQATRNLKIAGSIPGSLKAWVTIKITKPAVAK